MNDNFKNQIELFLKENLEVFEFGIKLSNSDISELNTDFLNKLPHWYIEMLTTFPLINSPIGVPFHNGQKKLIGNQDQDLPQTDIYLLHPKVIQNKIASFPFAKKLFSKGLVPIASSVQGKTFGDLYYLKINSSKSPLKKIDRIYGRVHFFPLKKSSDLILNNFEDLFVKGQVSNIFRRTPNENEDQIHELGIVLISWLEKYIETFPETLSLDKEKKQKMNSSLLEIKVFLEKKDLIIFLNYLNFFLQDYNVKITQEIYDTIFRSFQLSRMHTGSLFYLKTLIFKEN